MKKMKVVFHLNCLEQGGAERVVTTLANRFIEDCEVIIATLSEAENEYDIDPRIRRVHIGLTEEQEKKNRISKVLYRNLNLRKFIKKEKPDIVIAFAKKANYRALIASIGTKIPIIVSVRTNPYHSYVTKTDKILIPILYPRAAGVVFQTNGAKEFFPRKVQEKSRIIYNPINPKYLNVTKPQLRKKEVVQSGRIVDCKNQYMLIEAFTLVHEKHPGYILKIYGMDSKDGTWEKLEKCIEKHNLKDCVFLMGGSNQLEKELADASVFAFSSDWEGLPNTLMEAMAMGIPVISTDCPCGGPAMLIRHEENGLLVPVNDKYAMAEGINRLIENPEFAEKLGDEARRLVDVADTEKVYLQWKDYVMTLCGSSKDSI